MTLLEIENLPSTCEREQHKKNGSRPRLLFHSYLLVYEYLKFNRITVRLIDYEIFPIDLLDPIPRSIS